MQKKTECPICGKPGYEPRPWTQAVGWAVVSIGLILGILGLIEILTR